MYKGKIKTHPVFPTYKIHIVICYRQNWRGVVWSNVGRKRNSGSEKKWKKEKKKR